MIISSKVVYTSCESCTCSHKKVFYKYLLGNDNNPLQVTWKTNRAAITHCVVLKRHGGGMPWYLCRNCLTELCKCIDF